MAIQHENNVLVNHGQIIILNQSDKNFIPVFESDENAMRAKSF